LAATAFKFHLPSGSCSLFKPACLLLSSMGHVAAEDMARKINNNWL
jgi:hypothetical protein